jgi:hypothetical protein
MPVLFRAKFRSHAGSAHDHQDRRAEHLAGERVTIARKDARAAAGAYLAGVSTSVRVLATAS